MKTFICICLFVVGLQLQAAEAVNLREKLKANLGCIECKSFFISKIEECPECVKSIKDTTFSCSGIDDSGEKNLCEKYKSKQIKYCDKKQTENIKKCVMNFLNSAKNCPECETALLESFSKCPECEKALSSSIPAKKNEECKDLNAQYVICNGVKYIRDISDNTSGQLKQIENHIIKSEQSKPGESKPGTGLGR